MLRSHAPASLPVMSRQQGRFGLPALTTAEAFAAWLVLCAATIAVLLGVGELFDVVFPSFVMAAAIWLPLLLVSLTPKKPGRTKQ